MVKGSDQTSLAWVAARACPLLPCGWVIQGSGVREKGLACARPKGKGKRVPKSFEQINEIASFACEKESIGREGVAARCVVGHLI